MGDEILPVMTEPKNQNAVKYDQPATSHLHLRVTRRDKARWVRAAQARRMKLVDWLVEKLNAASGQ